MPECRKCKKFVYSGDICPCCDCQEKHDQEVARLRAALKRLDSMLPDPYMDKACLKSVIDNALGGSPPPEGIGLTGAPHIMVDPLTPGPLLDNKAQPPSSAIAKYCLRCRHHGTARCRWVPYAGECDNFEEKKE